MPENSYWQHRLYKLTPLIPETVQRWQCVLDSERTQLEAFFIFEKTLVSAVLTLPNPGRTAIGAKIVAYYQKYLQEFGVPFTSVSFAAEGFRDKLLSQRMKDNFLRVRELSALYEDEPGHLKFKGE